MASSNFTALYDANVMFPMILRDLLIRIGRAGLFKARWTEQIHEEWISAVLIARPGTQREDLRRTADLMNTAIPDCLIEDFELVQLDVCLPDPKDMHVLQAAVKGRADVIVTFNLKDFPNEILKQLDIESQHPDYFVSCLLDLAPLQVCQILGEQRTSYVKYPMDKDEFCNRLNKTGMAMTVEHLRQYWDLI